MTKRRVAVTGMGVVSPYGIGTEVYWDNISRGRTAARLIDTFDTSSLPVKFGAPVPHATAELEEYIENKRATKTMSRAGRFAVIAAAEAARQAQVAECDIDPWRRGTWMGLGGLGLLDIEYTRKALEIAGDSRDERTGRVSPTLAWKNTIERVHPLTPLLMLPNTITAHIAITHNARGHCQTTATACVSGSQALGEAARLIRDGICDLVFGGASDAMVNPDAFIAFSGLGVVSTNNEEYATAARPFDRTRSGFMIGEGAAVFVLEDLEGARRRGARVLAEVAGYGSTNDAFRITDEPPDGRGSIEAMRAALAEMNTPLDAVDYINVHGTGTRMNDRTETHAIKTVFGARAGKIPVSSTKSMIGHLVAAAGAVEFAACVLALQHQMIPPTINYGEFDPECDLDCVPNEARSAQVRTVMSNSFGFGGQNACLVLRHADAG